MFYTTTENFLEFVGVWVVGGGGFNPFMGYIGTLLLSWVCIKGEVTFSSSLRPSTKAFHNANNIGLN